MKTAPYLKLWESWHWLKVRGWGGGISYIMFFALAASWLELSSVAGRLSIG